MSENPTEKKPDDQNDSFNVPLKKSPIMVYALLQIPIVILMVVLIYFMYHARDN